MSLDTEPIRKRLAHIDPDFWWDACAPDEDDTVPSDSEFARHAPQDIAALLSEVDRLTAENEGLHAERALSVAVCPDCGEVTRCDEDRCCVSCGRDLIILADRHSADLLIELTGENEALRDELKTAQGQLACFKEDLRHVQVTLDQLRYHIERRDIY